MLESNLISSEKTSDIDSANFIFCNVQNLVLVDGVNGEYFGPNINFIHLFVFSLDVNFLIHKPDDLIFEFEGLMPLKFL